MLKTIVLRWQTASPKVLSLRGMKAYAGTYVVFFLALYWICVALGLAGPEKVFFTAAGLFACVGLFNVITGADNPERRAADSGTVEDGAETAEGARETNSR